MRSRSYALFVARVAGTAALASVLAPALAQDATPPQPARGEPAVQRTVHEDQGSKVEELKIRGEVKRITVTPKVGPKLAYEVLPADGARDLSQPGNRGSAGQRVWQVLSF